MKALLIIFFIISTFKVQSMEMHHCSYTEDGAGKRFPIIMNHDHEAMDQSLKQLRSSIPTLRPMSDSQIMGMMKMMGPNYFWPVSDNVDSEYGVLIMAHGFGPAGDLDLYNSVQSIASLHHTTLSMGMSMMTSSHIGCSVNEMTHKNLKKIFVVPVSSTSHNTLVKQWHYIFNLEEDYAYAEVNKVHNEKIIMLDPINDHLFAKKIILEYTEEISNDPSNEVLIIIGHGPIGEQDNLNELELMDNIGNYINEHTSIKNIQSFTLQDDAPKEVRDKNLSDIKKYIKESESSGKQVLMVSNLMSGKGIQRKLEKDFDGYNFIFNSKGMLTHPYYIDWIRESIDNYSE